ncbi:MAG: hypothetical protein UY23_C0001G0046 [Candidatus Jorgensenbacteria bacterium GW2011_GWA1_48_11]|uniref:Uncharacterized protein n=1 Tax=Candidatus Jorgensenbacteria bacterium GW2011_GWA1_48_11 TaxID=1618660 RepID=A0A0G1XAT3_9BACT|nr:MAG: hypothetical protein UY23_C0001G0046 [Candidatus Jorgensenbacteria bacterium GW2011_GWA1_48_11]KKW11934.1 MAG: hypothetical protein UY51_C0005G0176 [Candidatus Jorgensenbacteria bacterium GW2011_GWB1_49_9]
MGKSPGEDYLDVLKARRKEKRPPNREQALAEEIWLFFGKEITFPAILKIIRAKGQQAVYEIWNEVKKAEFPNKPALFLSLVKKEKVFWLDAKKTAKTNGRNPVKHK